MKESKMSDKYSPKDQKHSKKHERKEHICENGLDRPRIVCSEMCCYCFDVLISHLTSSQAPRNPFFTNEEL